MDAPAMDQLVATFATEDTAKGLDSVNTSKVTLAPRFLPINQSFTRQFLGSITPVMQNQILGQFVNGIECGIETEVLNQVYTNGTGLLYTGATSATTYVTGTKVIDNSDILRLEAQAPKITAIVGSNKVRAALKGRQKQTYLDFLWSANNTVNGYNAYASPFANDKLLIAGNWKSVVLGKFGGLIILNDPYSNKLKGDIDIQVGRLVDIKVSNPKNFRVIKNAI
jgi:hypothetical protein